MARVLGFFFFLYLLVFQVPAFGATAYSVEVAARLGGEIPPPPAPRVLCSFGGRTADISLDVVNHCGETAVGIKAEFVQISGKIAAPLGVVHERPYDKENKSAGSESISFALKIPEVQRETDFQLLYFAQKSPGGPWEPAGSTNIKVYPDAILDKLHAYAEETTFIIIDTSGAIQKLLKKEKVEFVDFLREAGKLDTIDPESRVVAICGIEPGSGEWAEGELEEQAAIVAEYADGLILIKKRSSELSPLVVKEKEEKVQVVAEMDLFVDLENNPRNQLNLLYMVDIVFAFLNPEKQERVE